MPISQLIFQIVDYSALLLYIARKLMPAQKKKKQQNEVVKAKFSFLQQPREVMLEIGHRFVRANNVLSNNKTSVYEFPPVEMVSPVMSGKQKILF